MNPIRINLLPHRQQKKARRQRMFVILAIAAAVAGLGVVGAGQMYLLQAKENQVKRNQFLKDEIAKLDQQIAEIKQFKEKSNELLARKEAVEGLQTNRGEAVQLFEEIARRLPDGLYLKSVKQSGDNIALSGFAQSSARVSSLMRNLDEAEMFNAPTLVEVKAATVGKQRVNEFSMNLRITRKAPPEAEKPAPPAKAAKDGKGGKT
ncbi:MAG: PilN domain-containing protein [Pseudomonadota bacterium]